MRRSILERWMQSVDQARHIHGILNAQRQSVMYGLDEHVCMSREMHPRRYLYCILPYLKRECDGCTEGRAESTSIKNNIIKWRKLRDSQRSNVLLEENTVCFDRFVSPCTITSRIVEFDNRDGMISPASGRYGASKVKPRGSELVTEYTLRHLKQVKRICSSQDPP